ncbi:exodeoxyribonuclease VII small subunit [bacterium]|nr:exodeoxyribonuclease VII small subunit [bacterium]
MVDANNSQEVRSFEESFKRLDEIARQLENSQTPLERSFELFSEGQKLIKECQDVLDKAEMKLKIIKRTPGGVEIEEKDIDG